MGAVVTGRLLWFGAWAGCDCTDVAPERADIPDRCPCHGGRVLGTSAISEGVSTNLGHLCTLPNLDTQETR